MDEGNKGDKRARGAEGQSGPSATRSFLGPMVVRGHRPLPFGDKFGMGRGRNCRRVCACGDGAGSVSVVTYIFRKEEEEDGGPAWPRNQMIMSDELM